MSKPPAADEFTIPLDLTELSIQDGIIRLRERLNDQSGRIYFYVKLSFPVLIGAVDELARYGVPAVVESGYETDEWSMVALLMTDKGGAARIEKAEIWSPGA